VTTTTEGTLRRKCVFDSELEEVDGSDPEYDETIDMSEIPLLEHKVRYFLIPQAIQNVQWQGVCERDQCEVYIAAHANIF